MASRERVVINIEVNTDIATIEATRESLERLARSNRDLNDEYDRRNKTLRETTQIEKRTKRDHDALGNALRGVGRSSKYAQGRYSGMMKEIFNARKDISKMIGAFGGLVKIVNKLSLVEIPLLAAGMAGITLLFKSGTPFVNLYRAAMSSLTYAAAGAAVALTTFLAAQREFQSVQFAPMYFEGATNTADRFVAASQAMKMFVDNTTLAVVGTESLTKAFSTLSKQAPVTGATTAAFEGLMNIVAGSGGDMGKGAEKLAEFLAKVQKSGLGGAGDVAKELGTDFEKVVKEAQGLGIKTSEEFFKAAAEGKLGETFATKYAGQLSAVNSTLMGQFKQFFVNVRSMLTDAGQDFLEPAKVALNQIQTIVERTVIQLMPMLRQFGTESFLGDTVKLIDRASTKFVELMTRYLGTAPGVFSYIGGVFEKIGGAFEKVQDWARQFVDAGQVIIDSFVNPVWDGLMNKFGGGMNYLADLVVANSGRIEAFANKIVDLIAAIGEYGNFIKEAFIGALPLLEKGVEVTTKLFEALEGVGRFIMGLGGKLGDMGKAVMSAAALYATLTIATRFFQVLSNRFGKDMTIRANNVYLNGAPVAGGGAVPAGNMYQRGMANAKGKYGRFSGYMNRNFGGVGPGLAMMAAVPAGMMLSDWGANTFGEGSTGAQYSSALGNAASMTGLGAMMGLNTAALPKIGKLGKFGPSGGALGLKGLGAAALIGTSANMAGNMIGSRFSDDSVRSRATSGLASAATGAAMGAVIGSAVPVIGTAVGAAIGGIVGGVSGYMKAGQARRDARNAANSLVTNYDEQITSAIKAGNVGQLRELVAGFEGEKVKNAAGDVNYYNETIDKQAEKINKLTTQANNFASNAELAEKYFGTSSDALNKLANEAGVDVTAKMMSFQEVLKLVSKNSDDAKRKLQGLFSGMEGELLGDIMGNINRVEESQRLGKAFDAAQQRVASGDVSEGAYRELIKSGLEYSTTKYGTMGGIASLIDTFKPENFGPGGAFEGFDFNRISTMMTDFGITDKDLARRLGPENAQALMAMYSGAGIAGLTEKNMPGVINNLGFAGLANAQNALVNNPFSKNNMGLRNVLGGAGYMVGPQAPGTTTNQATVIINASVLDDKTIKKIRDEVNKAMRDSGERGTVYTVTPYGAAVVNP